MARAWGDIRNEAIHGGRLDPRGMEEHRRQIEREQAVASGLPTTGLGHDAVHYRHIVAGLSEAAREALVDRVRHARRLGESWGMIAYTLGTTPRMAQESFENLV